MSLSFMWSVIGEGEKEKNKWLLTVSLQVANYANFLLIHTKQPMRKFASLIKSCFC